MRKREERDTILVNNTLNNKDGGVGLEEVEDGHLRGRLELAVAHRPRVHPVSHCGSVKEWREGEKECKKWRVRG